MAGAEVMIEPPLRIFSKTRSKNQLKTGDDQKNDKKPDTTQKIDHSRMKESKGDKMK